MAKNERQAELFPPPTPPEGTVVINDRCLVRTQDRHRVVMVSGIVLAQYAVGDQMAEAYAMVSLVEQAWARQNDVARAFGCSERSLRRHQRRFEDGGLSALGHASGYPKGRGRLKASRTRLIERLKGEGHSNREIARRVGVGENAVRKLLRRLGWKQQGPVQRLLPVPGRYSPADGNSHPGPGFNPYSAIYHYTATAANWTYDIDYQDGFIRVNDNPGRCPDVWPPDPGVRFSLGRASGSPGQVVEVPVLASSEFPLHTLQLALESDPPEVMVQSAEMKVKSLRSGEFVSFLVNRGQGAIYKECDVPGDESTCTYGIPVFVGFYDHPEARFTSIKIDIPPYAEWSNPPKDYPGTALAEIGRLHIWIPDGFTGSEIRLRKGTVPIDMGPLPDLMSETGGVWSGDFFPAKAFEEGVIRVIKPGKHFIRGDANLDRKVNLSDAITLLSHLFMGDAPLGCEDAGDVDASDRINITDPIFLLGSLFLGSGTIPTPYPSCGPDGEPDGLSCDEESCGQA